MKKAIIIGCPGSGKSTFGRKLSLRSGLPLYHLDMLYWKEDGTTVEKALFLERLRDALDSPKWIIDGNYASTMEMRMQACDTIFFLDYPTDVCLEGARERKGKPRSDIPWVESGELDAEFVDFIKSYNAESRPEVLRLLEKYSAKEVIVFRTRAESEMYLNSVREQSIL